ncbi:DUF2501 domain-containing protein [Novosphingobium sp. BL-8H]|uniref:DUF2501 domain-containing protein n=1 Tax=Novosphingobium sp. BL-8H TaxID=3127640 RepID=UPI0037566727
MKPFKTHRAIALIPVSFAALMAIGTATQISAQIPGMSSALPDVSSIGGSNAAGVLSYCAKNKLVDQVQGNSVYSALTKKPDVEQTSPSYTSGAAGNIIGGDGKTFSLDKAPKQVRQKACDMVLKQSKSLL